MDLRLAMRVERDSQIAFVGAGGKTIAISKLAQQLQPPVFITTTTHLACSQASFADKQVEWIKGGISPGLNTLLKSGIVLLTSGPGEENRLKGLSDPEIYELHQFCLHHRIPLLIEADGARQLSLKAPSEYEPAIPVFANHIVVLAGLSAIGKPLSANTVHRSEKYSQITGKQSGEIIQPEDFSVILRHPEGGLKNVPVNSRRTLILNQAENIDPVSIIRPVIQNTIDVFDSVIVAELQQDKVYSVHEKTTGIILAAGASERYGEPKQLTLWNGKPLIRHVIESALSSSLSEIIVVIGAVINPLLEILTDLPIRIVRNQHWQEGQSTSIQMGLDHVNEHSGAALFLLCDQPQIPVNLIDEILRVHTISLAPIIAPEFEGQRGNPVLFDRVTFSSLRSIKGDKGGRAIFKEFRPLLFPWNDSRILLDIDKPEDLAGLPPV